MIDGGLATMRCSMSSAPIARSITDREADFPGEVGSKIIGEVRTIRTCWKTAIFIHSQMVIEEISLRISKHRF
jgi:hypothetical protein